MSTDYPKQKFFMGIVEKDFIEVTFSSNPWEPIFFIEPPYPLVKTPPTYLLTLGSGCLTSMATTSPFGVAYNSGIDVFRTDFNSKNPNEPLINIDHYVASPFNPNKYAIFKDPTIAYHWPKQGDKILDYCPANWQFALKELLKQKK